VLQQTTNLGADFLQMNTYKSTLGSNMCILIVVLSGNGGHVGPIVASEKFCVASSKLFSVLERCIQK
jgi:hypothetical protein